MKNNDNFKFFVPFNVLEKAKNEEGKEVMRIKGIASTVDEDTDGEYMVPEGFELDYFNDYGFLNWHHQVKNNPLAIIGEPTKAFVKDNQLHVEGFLYDENPLAKQVYDLGEILQKSSKKRSLGFSIEGKVLERDSLNKKRVTKARITGLAVTPTPKNAQTLAEIVKGEIHEDTVEFDLIKDESNGGACYIVDVMRPSGERITVDTDFNIKVFKSLSTDEGRALIPESVEGSTKKTLHEEKNKDENLGNVEKGDIFNPDFIESCLYEQILDYTDNLSKAEQVFELVKSTIIHQNKIDMKKGQSIVITSEAIEKAFEVLGLQKGNTEEVTENQSENSEESQENSNEELDSLKKARDEKALELANLEKAIEKAQKGEMDDDSENEDDDDSENDENENEDEDNETEKGKKKPTMMKSESSEIIKAIEESNKANLQNQQALGTLVKGMMDALGEVSEKLTVAYEKIDALESQPQPRKSVQRYIEKSFDNDGMKNEDGSRELHIGRDKREILDILESKSNLEKGENVDMQMANAMSLYETSGTLPGAIISRLAKENKVIITSK